MKLTDKFRTIVEEEKSDYSKFDVLIRAGLANKAQMQRIHKILDKMHEERPQFNNADKMILQNLFNKMVDLISNNKAINLQARRAVRESIEESAVDVDTADYKIGPSGRKVRAHRFKVGEKVDRQDESVEAYDLEEARMNMPAEPPVILMLKRKAVRLYPDGQKVALYYNKQLDKHFSVPYGLESVVQAEEVQLEESVMDTLHKIVKEKQAQSVKFASGHSRKVDGYTASAITQVHKSLNDENKKKFSDLVHKSPEHFEKAAAFAFKHTK